MEERTYLLPSREQVKAFKIDILSGDAARALGVSVSTPVDWLAELWELWGDGRLFVDGQTLSYLCFKALTEQESLLGSSLLPATKGTASSLAQFYRRSAGPLTYSNVSPDVLDGLAPAEKAVLGLGVFVEEELSRRGLCLPGEACRCLLDAISFPEVVLMGNPELPWYLSWFLESIGVSQTVRTSCLVPPLSKGMSPAFLFPSGPSATARIISDYLRGYLDRRVLDGSDVQTARALLVCKDPLRSLSALSAQVAFDEVRLEFKGRIAVSSTGWGGLARILDSLLAGYVDNSLVSGLVDSPYSGLSSAEGRKVMACFRGDRSLVHDGALDFLREKVPHFDRLCQLVSSGFPEELVAWARELTCNAFSSDPLIQRVEVSALESLAGSFARASGLVSKRSVVLEFANEAQLPLSFMRGSDDAGLVVRLVDAESAGQVPERSYDLVVLAEGDSVSYAATSSHASLDALARKVGIAKAEDASARLRSWFSGLLRVATSEFCCCFCPTGEGGDERYPAFFVEELASHYQQGEALLGNQLGIGCDSGAYVLVQGEDDIVDNLSMAGGAICSQSEVSLSHALRRPKRLLRDDGSFVLSASALETYLSCPRKWFLSKKLKANSLDEDFGSLEQGSFVHEIWRRFYGRLPEPIDRVTRDNLEESQELLAAVFDEVLAEQPKNGSGRYLPLTDFEKRDVDSLRSTLLGNLVVHADLLPGFVPRCQEYSLTPDDGVMFAGALINGSVDRIDVDETTKRFAVLDYKGKVAGYAAGFDPDAVDKKTGAPIFFSPDGSLKIPSKIQSLVYAQVLRRAPDFAGYAPGAALYLNYRAQEPVSCLAGSCSQVLVPGVSLTDSSLVQGDFLHYLDLVEESLAPVVDRMKSGFVEPDPAGKDACSFCPDLNCPRRIK